jgi:hypothetical protein
MGARLVGRILMNLFYGKQLLWWNFQKPVGFGDMQLMEAGPFLLAPAGTFFASA